MPSLFSKSLLYLQRYAHQARAHFAKLFAQIPKRIMPRTESRRHYAETIIDLFATILRRIDDVSLEDIDAAIDMLRYNFPNVEHQWLIKRFDSAYDAHYPLEGMLTLSANRRTIEERYALALEIYTLLYQVDEQVVQKDLFAKVCYGLKIDLLPETVECLIRDELQICEDNSSLIESLVFSAQLGKGDFLLMHDDTDVRFRVLRCAHLTLIVNDADSPLYVRGRELPMGGMIPLHKGQEIELPSRSISYEHIQFLLQAKYAGVKVVNYLHLEDDTLTVTRLRTRHSIARMRIGLRLEIELLSRDHSMLLHQHQLQPHTPVTTGYYAHFTIDGKGPYIFANISQYLGQERRFYLNPTHQKILVTNIPDTNRPGALMLTAGLASECIFEVSYSRSSNTGQLRILEGCAGLMIDQQPVKSNIVDLKDGDLINLSPAQSLRCRFSIGVLDEESGSIEHIEVRGLSKDYPRSGRVLDNIALSLKRGEMACILGPSGSGKSTLLSLLAGHQNPSYGSILYNGELLKTSSQQLRRHIAYIPREDILDEAMTVEEHIIQASIIRRPRLSRGDLMRRVQTVLNFIGLEHLAERRVGRAGERTISDGERSRLNLGLDLTGTAEVYLIDEPISGLSSGDAERVIKTLEDMAEGRILLCSLHRPASSLLNRFDKVLVLDNQGHMAFWGSPSEMMDYFQEAAQEMQLRISPESVKSGGSDYVFEVLEAPTQHFQNHRNKNTRFWQERFESLIYRKQTSKKRVEPKQHKPITPRPSHNLYELFKLFMIWVNRTFLGRVRSRMGLYALLLEGPVLGLLIAGTLRAASEQEYSFYKALHISEYLFLSIILAMFFGLMVAACEVLRDRSILKRESNYKVFVTGYLLSKVFVLTGLATVQCALYLLVSNWILEIHLMFWMHLGVMALTAFVGISISLMVSTFARSERVALNIVPLTLVPQILLAGALVKFEEMNDFIPTVEIEALPQLGQLRHRVAYQDKETHDIKTKAVPLIAEFCPLRYAFELIFIVQTEENRWEQELSTINDRREYLKSYGTDDELRFIQRAVLALNSVHDDDVEARRTLRRVRNAALRSDHEYLDHLAELQIEMSKNPKAQPLEFFYANRELTSIREGVKSARKDARLSETRGFFLSSRQPRLLHEMEQISDQGSISTIWRNLTYLFIMGLVPILISAWQIKRISRKSL